MSGHHPFSNLRKKPKRDVVLKDLATLLEEYWGPRCLDRAAGCAACAVWAVYDAIAQLTDNSDFEKEADQE